MKGVGYTSQRSAACRLQLFISQLTVAVPLCYIRPCNISNESAAKKMTKMTAVLSIHALPVKCFKCEAAALGNVRFAVAVTKYRFFFYGKWFVFLGFFAGLFA